MMGQTQETFDWTEATPEPVPERKLTIDERFEIYDRENPEIYAEFCRLARQLRDRGYSHYGAKGIIEVLRYHRAVDSRPEDQYKLNDHFTSRYVRKLIEEDPSFGNGFFELRVLKSRQ